jgi:hypothetical protein
VAVPDDRWHHVDFEFDYRDLYPIPCFARITSSEQYQLSTGLRLRLRHRWDDLGWGCGRRVCLATSGRHATVIPSEGRGYLKVAKRQKIKDVTPANPAASKHRITRQKIRAGFGAIPYFELPGLYDVIWEPVARF